MPRNEAVMLETADPEIGQGAPRYPSDARSQPVQPVAPGQPGALPPAAWYADPENTNGMRYWDGGAWTEHKTDYRAATPKPPPGEGMVAAGYIFAFLFPIVGVVIGAMLIRRRSRHGRWVLALSLLLMLGFYLVGLAIEPNSS